MSLRQADEARLGERAADWLRTLQDSNAERTAFFDWLAESPRHVEVFLETLVVAQEIGELTPERIASIEAMAQQGSEPLAEVVPLPRFEERRLPVSGARKGAWHTHWAAGIAASLVLAAGAAWLIHQRDAGTYTTAVGEQRVLELADGSIVHLNTQSRLQVRYSDTARRIELLEGQASFKVKAEAARPFVVSSGETRIQALGTEFDVYRRAAEVRVAVIEGVVQISRATEAPHVAAGEAAEVKANGRIVKHRQADPAQATAWRHRRLVFHEETLGEIAAEFNRYNTAPKVRVLGAAAGEHFSGTFDADSPETLLRMLEGDETLAVERGAREIVIRAR